MSSSSLVDLKSVVVVMVPTWKGMVSDGMAKNIFRSDAHTIEVFSSYFNRKLVWSEDFDSILLGDDGYFLSELV